MKCFWVITRLKQSSWVNTISNTFLSLEVSNASFQLLYLSPTGATFRGIKNYISLVCVRSIHYCLHSSQLMIEIRAQPKFKGLQLILPFNDLELCNTRKAYYTLKVYVDKAAWCPIACLFGSVMWMIALYMHNSHTISCYYKCYHYSQCFVHAQMLTNACWITEVVAMHNA
jgi:hypothetical protein